MRSATDVFIKFICINSRSATDTRISSPSRTRARRSNYMIQEEFQEVEAKNGEREYIPSSIDISLSWEYIDSVQNVPNDLTFQSFANVR